MDNRRDAAPGWEPFIKPPKVYFFDNADVLAGESDDGISKSLLYYAERLKPEKATQITAHLRRPYSQGRIRVIDPFSCFHTDFFDQR